MYQRQCLFKESKTGFDEMMLEICKPNQIKIRTCSVFKHKLTRKLPPGLLITAAIQYSRNERQAFVFLNFKLIFIVLINSIAQRPGSGTLHFFAVIVK